MSDYFLDSSALVKRYLTELGTDWGDELLRPSASQTVRIAEIAQVEMAAALSARHRTPRGIARRVRDTSTALLAAHGSSEYRLVAAQRPVLGAAIDLTQRHRLRAYDAVQLATALTVDAALQEGGLPGLMFVTANGDLHLAARAEGLPVDDPNLHP